MNARSIAGALVAAALLIQLVLAAQWRDEAAVLADTHQRLQRERREMTRRIAVLERQAALQARIGRASATVPTDVALHTIRSSVVKSLGRVRGTRLEVRPGPSPALATVSIATEGSFFDVVALLSALGREGSGLVVLHVAFFPSGSTVRVQVEAAALEAS